MRSRINLFNPKKQEYQISPEIIKFRKYAMVTMGAMFVAMMIAFLINLRFQTQISRVQKDEEVLSQFVNQNTKTENDLDYFIQKKQLLKKYLQDDIEFSVYYNNLTNLLDKLEGQPQLDLFSLDKSRDTSFVLVFSDYDAAKEFSESLESSDFLQNFTTLKLTNLNISTQRESGQENFRIELVGQFKEINDKSI